MTTYLLTIAAIFGVMVIGIGVERLYRYFQARHPELGPYRRRDGGCNCHCPACDEACAKGEIPSGEFPPKREDLKHS